MKPSNEEPARIKTREEFVFGNYLGGWCLAEEENPYYYDKGSNKIIMKKEQVAKMEASAA